MLNWPLKFRRCRRGYIFNHLIIIIKSELSTFITVVIFSMAVWLYHDMICCRFHISYTCIYICIYIIYPEKARVLFHYNCAVLGFAQIIEYIMARWSYSLVWTLPYLIIIIMQIFWKVFNFWNACKVHSVECVPKIKPVLSTKSLVMIVKYTCSFSYYYHQIGRMNHLALFRVRSWNNGMRCMSFYVLIMTSWHWKNFPHDPPLWRKSTSYRWIPLWSWQ